MNELFSQYIAYERGVALAKAREEVREEERRANEREKKASAHKMLEAGLPSYKIAEFLNVAQATVDAWLAEN